MSYVQANSPSSFIFYYTPSEVYDKVLMETSYKGEVTVTDKGELVFDSITLSADESYYIDSAFKDALSQLVTLVRKILIDDTQATFENAIINVNGRSIFGYGFKVYRNVTVGSTPITAYSKGVVLQFDNAVLEYIWRHIVSAWYKTRNLDSREADIKLAETARKLEEYAFEFHKPIVLIK